MLNSAPALPQLLIQTVVSEALVEDRAKDDITTNVLQNKNNKANIQQVPRVVALYNRLANKCN